MIAVYAKIPFRRQLRQTDPALTARLERGFGAAARDLGASLRTEEEAFLLGFAEGEGSARLRAAEALRGLELLLREEEPSLLGWFLALDLAPDDPEEACDNFAATWLSVFGDGVFAGEAGRKSLAGYLECEEGPAFQPVRGYPAARPPLPPTWRSPSPEESFLERITEELGRHARGESRARILAAVGPGDSPLTLLRAGLDRLFGAGLRLLVLRPGPEQSPLAPFVDGLAGGEGGALSAAARLVAASPYRKFHSESLLSAFRVEMSRNLAAFAAGEGGRKGGAKRGEESPAFVLLEDLDSWPAASLDLLRGLLADAELRSPGPRGEGPEGLPLLIASATNPPPSLGGAVVRIVSAPPPGPGAIAQAAREGAAAAGRPELAPLLASTARGDAFRLSLAIRVAERGGPELVEALGRGPVLTRDLVTAALATWPPDFSAFLHALGLADEALDAPARAHFLEAAGYPPGIRPLLTRALESLGLIEGGDRPRIARAEVGEALDFQRERMGGLEAIFAKELLGLHASRKILPSLAFHRRLRALGRALPGGPAAPGAPPSPRGQTSAGTKGGEDPSLLLDCIAADLTYGPSEEAAEGPPSGLLAASLPLWTAFASEDLPAPPLAAFEARVLEAGKPPLEQAILDLFRATDDYALGAASSAAAKTRPALMVFHGLGSRRAEARAHRLLGLCSLAARQVVEGSEYLNNAYELAGLVQDARESFLAARAAAGACFVLGDLRNCEHWLRKARAAAEGAFREDWIVAADFLSGRLAFELGRYGAAEESFLDAASRAGALELDRAVLRASLWAGRAASYAGAGEKARAAFDRAGADSEAAWFRAEVLAWEGAWEETTALAAEALALLPRSSRRPVDTASWESGFDMLEGPSLGADPGCFYLEDQLSAFAAFARSMATGDPASLAAITARTREQRLASIHPQAHLYDYYAFIACESMPEPPVDPGTLLSRAWKALQTRTLRMEESSLKNLFLESNRWNREIVAAARARRLV